MCLSQTTSRGNLYPVQHFLHEVHIMAKTMSAVLSGWQRGWWGRSAANQNGRMMSVLVVYSNLALVLNVETPHNGLFSGLQSLVRFSANLCTATSVTLQLHYRNFTKERNLHISDDFAQGQKIAKLTSRILYNRKNSTPCKHRVTQPNCNSGSRTRIIKEGY